MDQGDDLVGAGFIRAIAERDVGALASEALDDSAADALIAAGDCRHFPFEPVGHVSLPWGFVVQPFRCAVEEFVSVDLRGSEGNGGLLGAGWGAIDRG